jgi:hypothetical protein
MNVGRYHRLGSTTWTDKFGLTWNLVLAVAR